MFQPVSCLCAAVLALGLLAPASGAHAAPAHPPTAPKGASAQPGATAAAYQRLLELSSLDLVLRQMPAYFQLGLEQVKAQGVSLPPPVQAAFEAAAAEVLAPEQLRPSALALLQTHLNDSQLAEWLAFYRTPLGKKAAAADQRAASPEFQALLQNRAPQVMAKLSQDAGRMALLQSWLQATEAVEQSTDLMIQAQLGVAWGLAVALPGGAGVQSFDELKDQMEAQRFSLNAQVAQALLVHMAVAYQDFSNKELGQLLRLANRPAGKAFYIDFSRQISQLLSARMEQLGHTIGRKLDTPAI